MLFGKTLSRFAKEAREAAKRGEGGIRFLLPEDSALAGAFEDWARQNDLVVGRATVIGEHIGFVIEWDNKDG